MSYINEKIELATVNYSPIPHVVIENFFNKEDYFNLKQNFEQSMEDFVHQAESYWGDPNNDQTNKIKNYFDQSCLYTLYHKFNVVESDRYQFVREKLLFSFKYDNEDTQTQDFWHIDRGSIFTIQCYMVDQEYDNGGLTMSKYSNSFQSKELPLKKNYCVIFPTAKNTFHKVRQRWYERKSLLVRFLHPDSKMGESHQDDKNLPLIRLHTS